MTARAEAAIEEGGSRVAFLVSGLLHAAVLAFLFFGPPSFFKSRDSELPIAVDLVMIDQLAETATAPKPAEPVKETRAQPKPLADPPKPPPTPPAKLPEPKEAPPAPPPPPAEAAPPQPTPPAVAETPPEPAPEPVKAVEAPKEVVEAKPDLPPEPKPEEPVKAETAPTPPKPVAKPRDIAEAKKPAKPETPKPAAKEPEPKPEEKNDPLASVLKNVQKLASQAPAASQVAAADAEAQPSPPPAATQASEVQTAELQRAVRQQMERCWRVDPGAQNADDVTVRIKVRLAQDGSVLPPIEFLEEGRYRGELAYRVAAEGARRAVLSCQPFRLPPRQYDAWKELTLNFNPRDMF